MEFGRHRLQFPSTLQPNNYFKEAIAFVYSIIRLHLILTEKSNLHTSARHRCWWLSDFIHSINIFFFLSCLSLLILILFSISASLVNSIDNFIHLNRCRFCWINTIDSVEMILKRLWNVAIWFYGWHSRSAGYFQYMLGWTFMNEHLDFVYTNFHFHIIWECVICSKMKSI